MLDGPAETMTERPDQDVRVFPGVLPAMDVPIVQKKDTSDYLWLPARLVGPVIVLFVFVEAVIWLRVVPQFLHSARSKQENV